MRSFWKKVVCTRGCFVRNMVDQDFMVRLVFPFINVQKALVCPDNRLTSVGCGFLYVG